MVKGTVKWFNRRKGFGFIAYEDGTEKKDIFVHYSSIKQGSDENNMIYDGDIVEFNITEGRKGPQAIDVIVIERGPILNRYLSRRKFF